jgi:hypothetical protein
VPGPTLKRASETNLITDGFASLRPWTQQVSPSEWEDLDYVDWKSGGDTRFAPLASANGELDCTGFWEHGMADVDGVWTANARRCPSLVEWVLGVGAPYGRVRVIELQPNTRAEALSELHLDANNRLNPAGAPRIVRAWLQLTDDPASTMILRREPNDASAEIEISLPLGAQFVVDSERLYHAAWHRGTRPRYALIASFTMTPGFEKWIRDNQPE